MFSDKRATLGGMQCFKLCKQMKIGRLPCASRSIRTTGGWTATATANGTSELRSPHCSRHIEERKSSQPKRNMKTKLILSAVLSGLLLHAAHAEEGGSR
jgi:hypothetical protein